MKNHFMYFSVPEAETGQKNGASPKSLTSRRNFIKQ